MLEGQMKLGQINIQPHPPQPFRRGLAQYSLVWEQLSDDLEQLTVETGACLTASGAEQSASTAYLLG